eukprot:1160261-Pelagomonas_calceolata.AAC.13
MGIGWTYPRLQQQSPRILTPKFVGAPGDPAVAAKLPCLLFATQWHRVPCPSHVLAKAPADTTLCHNTRVCVQVQSCALDCASLCVKT